SSDDRKQKVTKEALHLIELENFSTDRKGEREQEANYTVIADRLITRRKRFNYAIDEQGGTLYVSISLEEVLEALWDKHRGPFTIEVGPYLLHISEWDKLKPGGKQK